MTLKRKKIKKTESPINKQKPNDSLKIKVFKK